MLPKNQTGIYDEENRTITRYDPFKHEIDDDIIFKVPEKYRGMFRDGQELRFRSYVSGREQSLIAIAIEATDNEISDIPIPTPDVMVHTIRKRYPNGFMLEIKAFPGAGVQA